MNSSPLLAVAFLVLSAASSVQFAADAADSHAMSERNFRGNAHWYGGHFHGKRTASGEVFDKMKLTAAHPSLPFGTKVRVKSIHTGKEVVVKVNDRCPALKVRCIDLSEGAARQLGIWPAAPGTVECVVVKHDARSHSAAKSPESSEVAEVAQPGM